MSDCSALTCSGAEQAHFNINGMSVPAEKTPAIVFAAKVEFPPMMRFSATASW